MFASVFVVMKGHVFAKNITLGACSKATKKAGHLADSQTVKNCAISKRRCLAIYTQSLWGLQKCIFLRIYMATVFKDELCCTLNELVHGKMKESKRTFAFFQMFRRHMILFGRIVYG